MGRGMRDNWISTLGGIVGGAFFGPVGAGAGSALGGLAEGDEFGEAMMGGLMSFGLGTALQGVGDTAGALVDPSKLAAEAGGATAKEVATETLRNAGTTALNNPNFDQLLAQQMDKAAGFSSFTNNAFSPTTGMGNFSKITTAGNTPGVGYGELFSTAIKNPKVYTGLGVGGAAGLMNSGALQPESQLERLPIKKYASRAPNLTEGPLRVKFAAPANYAAGYSPEFDYGFAEGGNVAKIDPADVGFRQGPLDGADMYGRTPGPGEYDSRVGFNSSNFASGMVPFGLGTDDPSISNSPYVSDSAKMANAAGSALSFAIPGGGILGAIGGGLRAAGTYTDTNSPTTGFMTMAPDGILSGDFNPGYAPGAAPGESNSFYQTGALSNRNALASNAANVTMATPYGPTGAHSVAGMIDSNTAMSNPYGVSANQFADSSLESEDTDEDEYSDENLNDSNAPGLNLNAMEAIGNLNEAAQDASDRTSSINGMTGNAFNSIMGAAYASGKGYNEGVADVQAAQDFIASGAAAGSDDGFGGDYSGGESFDGGVDTDDGGASDGGARYAQGGLVPGSMNEPQKRYFGIYKDGGPVRRYALGENVEGIEAEQVQQNPIVMDAVAAITGNHPNPEGAIAQFVKIYGQEALIALRDEVIAEASSENRQASGLGALEGPGTGLSDDIPAVVQDGGMTEPAALSVGEQVIPADVVSMLGEGSTEAGSKKIDNMVNEVRMQKTGTGEQAGPLNMGRVSARVA